MASEVTKPQVVEFVRDRDKTGHGDPEDKVRNIEQFADGTRWALEALGKQDFLKLVFLKMSGKGAWTTGITACSRTLREVAVAALNDTGPGFNRDHERFRIYYDNPNFEICRDYPIILREAWGDETRFGEWYILDGNGRSLAYAMHVMNGTTAYRSVWAYKASRLPMES